MVGGPVDGVGVEVVLVAAVGQVGATVVDCGVAFSVVVGLDLGVVRAEPFPVDLVEVVGLQDEGADDADTLGSLHDNIVVSEHHVPF